MVLRGSQRPSAPPDSGAATGPSLGSYFSKIRDEKEAGTGPNPMVVPIGWLQALDKQAEKPDGGRHRVIC